MMFLLLKPERGHFFRHYFNAYRQIILCGNFIHQYFISIFFFCRPHDVLAFEVGAWSTLHHFIITEKDMSKSYRSQLNIAIFYI